MQPRFSSFAAAIEGPRSWASLARLGLRNRTPQFVCRACRSKFSTTRARFAKETGKATGNERRYPSKLLIYDAGDARTTWISFWKAVAILECGTALVFAVPPVWKNENQPDPNLRKAQAVMIGILSAIPALTLAYVTAPFTHRVYMQIPEYARRSRSDLMKFANTLTSRPNDTANTKLDFVTLRIFPFRKETGVFLHELRALPPRKMRLANIELPKSDAWAQRQRAKGVFRRMFDVINEPRFKFYVKEGRTFTQKSGVPGVWEEVARRIQDQTIVEEQRNEQSRGGTSGTGGGKGVGTAKAPVKPVISRNRVKRQTSRAGR
ncbi:hypothetical protein BKA63DRAFT_506833 [Paraphoma chrysanthemicola]|nr:hypothetical protein BKA63DRAFT_506833 [Paraphoma chrysanthemicola]